MSGIRVSPLGKDGILIDDTKQKEEILNEQYHSVFTVDDINEKIPTLSDNYPNMSHINISLSRDEVPSDWRQANVIPVFEKGGKYLANNYKSVSLTCICCKVLEHIVVSNMVKHLEIHDILVDCQHGFRAKRSCETQLISLTHELLNNLHSGIEND